MAGRPVEQFLNMGRKASELANLTLNPGEALVNIPRIVPLDVALPCYGYIIPAVVLVTVVTNTLITIVLSDKSLNTKTNQILLGMAVTEMLTGLSSLPWFLYYYTLRGYEEDMARGMPPVWCTMHRFLSEILPRGFHTASIWLTVLLSMRRYCTVSTVLLRSSRKGIPVKIPIVLACVAAALLELPMAFSRRASSFQKANRTYCVQRLASWVSAIGPSKFFIGSVWFNVVFVHAGPCILLVIYTGLLIRFIRGRAKRRRFATSLRQPNRYHSNAQMLAIILCIFLAAEIPAVVIYVMHVLHLTFKIVPPHGYHAMNIAIILRNVFIVASCPFNLVVYLLMSEQFRKVARQLLERTLAKALLLVPGHSRWRSSTSACLKSCQTTTGQRVVESASAPRLAHRYSCLTVSEGDRPR
uniref:G_PROTEIN_RECEP_F1_2 domain-containing protein n=1 Tax=Trichuris muris TaxID=70415 RepID=A0A5S6QSJ7_TRIMR